MRLQVGEWAGGEIHSQTQSCQWPEDESGEML